VGWVWRAISSSDTRSTRAAIAAASQVVPVILLMLQAIVRCGMGLLELP
jgi:hypothetical protein